MCLANCVSWAHKSCMKFIDSFMTFADSKNKEDWKSTSSSPFEASPIGRESSETCLAEFWIPSWMEILQILSQTSMFYYPHSKKHEMDLPEVRAYPLPIFRNSRIRTCIRCNCIPTLGHCNVKKKHIRKAALKMTLYIFYT